MKRRRCAEEQTVEAVKQMKAGRLRALEEENRRLKTLVAELSLEKEALKAVIRKNRWSL